MSQYLLTIEFIYSDEANSYDSTDRVEKNTVGVYWTIEEALKGADSICEALESRFPLNENYNTKQRLNKRLRLMSNLGYIRTPFDFYLKIETLTYKPIDKAIEDVIGAQERYIKYKQTKELL